MPKTPMYKDYFSPGGEDKIRIAGQVLRMKAVAIAHSMHKPAHGHFGLRVSTAYAGHAFASFGLCQGVIPISHRIFLAQQLIQSSWIIIIRRFG